MKRLLVVGMCLLLLSCGGGGDGNSPAVGGDPDNPYLTWDENTEPDLAGYMVYWGEQPGVYIRSLDVEMDRVVYLSTIELFGGTNYFAVTAYDSSGNESDFSEEISYEL